MRSVQCGFVTPTSIVLTESSNIILKCNSFDKAHWSKENGNISKNHLTTWYFLTLLNVTREDEGTYICNGNCKNGTTFNASTKVLVGGKITYHLVYSLKATLGSYISSTTNPCNGISYYSYCSYYKYFHNSITGFVVLLIFFNHAVIL